MQFIGIVAILCLLEIGSMMKHLIHSLRDVVVVGTEATVRLSVQSRSLSKVLLLKTSPSTQVLIAFTPGLAWL